MLKQVFFAYLLVVISPICSEAGSYRISQAPECNVIMPCDLSSTQTRGERISPHHCRRIAQNNFSHGREHKGVACWWLTTGLSPFGRPAALLRFAVAARRCECLVVWCLN